MSVIEGSTVPVTTVSRWTGREAKLLREALRLSVRDFAARLGVGVRTVNKWEARQAGITPLPYMQEVLDTALARASDEGKARFAAATHADVPGHEAAQSPELPLRGGMLPVVVNGHLVFVPFHAETVASSGLSALLDELAAIGVVGDCAIALGERVQNQGVTAAALSALGLDEVRHVAVALDDARRYLDGSVVDYFRRRLDACKADDGNLGSRKALPLVLGILGAIEQHGREVKPDVRRQLLSLGAEGAEFAGWLCRDIRDAVAAGYWHDRATEWAQEVGDTGMQGYVLLKKSQMVYEERDALRVYTLAEAAQCGPWQLPTKVRAEVTQQVALGLAMLGEPMDAVERKLDDARALLAALDPDDEQPGLLGAYFNEGTLLLRSASCYAEAGDPARAAALFYEVITSGSLSRRDEGFFRARRASALALSGEPDEAATVGLESVQVAKAMNSERTIRVLTEVVRALNSWSRRPAVCALREALSV
ncbi:MAG TPA: helix-turn-helix domain-containing protein [Pseudonocardiaceae bacterium]|nr:helix-turn-helix domain-containing protein [Pseudonocardiaceae bacterium]